MNGIVPTVLECEVCQEIAGRNHVQVFLGSLLQGGVQVLAHAFEAQVGERVLQALVFRPVCVLLMTKASYSSREGSARRIW
jgi:hypothetical protein